MPLAGRLVVKLGVGPLAAGNDAPAPMVAATGAPTVAVPELLDVLELVDVGDVVDPEPDDVGDVDPEDVDVDDELVPEDVDEDPEDDEDDAGWVGAL